MSEPNGQASNELCPLPWAYENYYSSTIEQFQRLVIFFRIQNDIEEIVWKYWNSSIACIFYFL